MGATTLKGVHLASGTPRTITAADTATGLANSSAFKALSNSKVVVLGGSPLYVQAAHNNSAGTLTVYVAYYDIDDNLIGVSDAVSLPAGVVQHPASTYLSELSLQLNQGAYAVRLFATALANSTSIALYIGFVDGSDR